MRLSYAVLLAGGAGKTLHPLNSAGTPKALLPVGNQALISFPLNTLEQGGITHVIVVVGGEAASSKVSQWLSKSYSGSLHVEVKTVPEDIGSAAALTHVKEDIKAESFVVISGDLLTDISLQTLAASHHTSDATVTILLKERRVSPSSETKLGKAPKNVDYIGVDSEHHQMLFIAPSREAKRQVRVPMSALQHGRLTLRTDLVDVYLYIFTKHTVFAVLEARPSCQSIKQDLLPYLVRQQFRSHPFSPTQSSGSESTLQAADSLATGSHLVDVISGACKGKAISKKRGLWCNAFVAGKDAYCGRADTLQAFGDVSRDLTSFELASRMLSDKPNSRFENFMHESVQLGSKATVSAGCIVGKGSVLGDKCSVKRSIIGSTCKLGNNVKIVSSIVMDDVIVEEGSHIQNSIICSGSHLKESCNVRDCKIGPGYLLAEGSEPRDEILAKQKLPQ